MATSEAHFMSLDEARQKCTEKNSCFHRIEQTEHMCVSPSYMGRLKEGVNKELSQKLMKFCEKLQAVIVAYDKIQLLQPFGGLFEESLVFHLDVKVDYIIFKPEVDSQLVGEVNKFGYDHIGCLVNGYFNASVAKPRIQNGYDTDRLTIGSKFTFRVVGLESLNGILLITGVIDDESLRTSSTKSKTSESTVAGKDIQNETDRPQSSRKHKHKSKESDDIIPSKKRKDVNGNQSSNTEDYSDGSGIMKLYRKKTKKKKKVYY